MRKTLLTVLMTLVWLLASPTLQLRDSGWAEVGVPPAAAEPSKDIKKKPVKKARKSVRRASSSVIQSNAPGFHPMQAIAVPDTPRVTGSVREAAPVPGYPQVPTVAVIGRETSQDRVARCMHQGALGGLSAGEQGAYIHTCAFQ